MPFLYNMDGRIDKLDVIDFPGVDDVSTVPQMTKLLVNLAQVVIFVVDYRYSPCNVYKYMNTWITTSVISY